MPEYNGACLSIRQPCYFVHLFVGHYTRRDAVPVIPHRGGSVYGIQLVISHTNCPLAESFGTGEPGNEVMARFTAPYEKGYYLPTAGPGFGVEFPDEFLRKHAPSLL